MKTIIIKKNKKNNQVFLNLYKLKDDYKRKYESLEKEYEEKLKKKSSELK